MIDLSKLKDSQVETFNILQKQIGEKYDFDDTNTVSLVEYYDLDDALDLDDEVLFDMDMSRTPLPEKPNFKIVATIDKETKKKAWKYVRIGGNAHLSPAQKRHMKEMQRKSHSANANRERKKTLELREKLGL